MVTLILQFVGLAVVIVAAGTILARCADGIAEATGLGRMLVGMVLLAGATSLPELTVDLSAIKMNLPDLAVGDLIGSCLMNLLILALLDLAFRSRKPLLSRAASAHALSAVVSIGLLATVGCALLTTHRIPHWTLFGVHAWILVVTAGYILGVRMIYLDQKIAHAAAVHDAATPAHVPSLTRCVTGFAAAATVILLTGPLLAETAGAIAEQSGLGNTFVGSTLVALCTSLPELSASLAAIRMGSVDLAVGNVFGSNAFNLLLLLPLDLAYPGALLAALNPAHSVSVLAVIAATSVVVISQLYNLEQRILFLEPDAVAVILIILALAMIYFVS